MSNFKNTQHVLLLVLARDSGDGGGSGGVGGWVCVFRGVV